MSAVRLICLIGIRFYRCPLSRLVVHFAFQGTEQSTQVKVHLHVRSAFVRKGLKTDPVVEGNGPRVSFVHEKPEDRRTLGSSL